MTDWIDCTPDIERYNLCGRLCMWPFQSAVACTHACKSCDACGILKVCFCCPVSHFLYYYAWFPLFHLFSSNQQCLYLSCVQCRTCCGWCPTDAEKQNSSQPVPTHEEPEEIPYSRVFELEQKKRQLFKPQVN